MSNRGLLTYQGVLQRHQLKQNELKLKQAKIDSITDDISELSTVIGDRLERKKIGQEAHDWVLAQDLDLQWDDKTQRYTDYKNYSLTQSQVISLKKSVTVALTLDKDLSLKDFLHKGKHIDEEGVEIKREDGYKTPVRAPYKYKGGVTLDDTKTIDIDDTKAIDIEDTETVYIGDTKTVDVDNTETVDIQTQLSGKLSNEFDDDFFDEEIDDSGYYTDNLPEFNQAFPNLMSGGSSPKDWDNFKVDEDTGEMSVPTWTPDGQFLGYEVVSEEDADKYFTFLRDKIKKGKRLSDGSQEESKYYKMPRGIDEKKNTVGDIDYGYYTGDQWIPNTGMKAENKNWRRLMPSNLIWEKYNTRANQRLLSNQNESQNIKVLEQGNYNPQDTLNPDQYIEDALNVKDVSEILKWTLDKDTFEHTDPEQVKLFQKHYMDMKEGDPGWGMFGPKTTAKFRSFKHGGSYVTDGPEMIMVGDNQSGRERVEVTPLNDEPLANKGRFNDTHIREFETLSNEKRHVTAYEAFLIDSFGGDAEDAILNYSAQHGGPTINPETGLVEHQSEMPAFDMGPNEGGIMDMVSGGGSDLLSEGGGFADAVPFLGIAMKGAGALLGASGLAGANREEIRNLESSIDMMIRDQDAAVFDTASAIDDATETMAVQHDKTVADASQQFTNLDASLKKLQTGSKAISTSAIGNIKEQAQDTIGENVAVTQDSLNLQLSQMIGEIQEQTEDNQTKLHQNMMTAKAQIKKLKKTDSWGEAFLSGLLS